MRRKSPNSAAPRWAGEFPQHTLTRCLPHLVGFLLDVPEPFELSSNAAGSLGATINPVTPSSTTSGMLATLLQIAGVPQAIASNKV